MCGIAGIFHRRGGRPSASALDAMTDVLTHRGPDGRGVYLHEGVGLGHRRLSIIGLSDGAQPMANRDRTIWVTYNGEIYNYLELKAELQQVGFEFKTHSDTEVIVHGYEAWGTDVIERLRGIFAFTLHDQNRGRLIGVRDRLGVKPYYYHLTPELFLFGSEPKAILQHPDMPKRPDLDAVRLAMMYGYVPGPYAAFEGMKQLEPGSYLVVDADRDRVVRYWRPPFIGVGANPPDDGEVDQEVDDTVSIELMSEVPLGAFLSGGIDSSVVAASIAKNPKLTEKPRTFCIGFPEPEYDESPHAKNIAEALGLDFHVETMSIDALGLLDKLVGIYDEPFADASAIPTFALCQMAQKHVTVALSGDGGDEIFGGYRRYSKLHQYRESPWPVRRLTGMVSEQMPVGVRGQGRLRRMSMTLSGQYDYELQMFGERELAAWFTPDLQRDVDWSLGRLFDRAEGPGPVQRAQWTDVMSYLPYDILTKVDRASMACSLEVRVPLLDHVFIERMSQLAPSRAFGDGKMKVALKDHLGRRVPRPLFERPKQGFGVPLEYWLKGDGGLSGIADRLRSRHPKKQFYAPIQPEALDTILMRHGAMNLSALVWSVLFLETWWQKHFV